MHTTLVLALWLSTAAASAGQQSTHAQSANCPADNSRARQVVERFLTATSLADVRQQYGLADVRVANLRVLTDAQDLASCRTLSTGVTFEPVRYPLDSYYYFADGFYFIVGLHQVPADRTYIGQVPLAVLDSNFDPVGFFSR